MHEKFPAHVSLDVKSTPRSGLHVVAHILKHVLEDQFSFCEWYNEPGCCKRQPCAISHCYARETRQGRVSVRMQKSHDFNLEDTRYPTTASARRLVLVREPLFVLTSWFALQALQYYAPWLAEFGIKTRKIFYQHESAIVTEAFRIVDSEGPFKVPTAEMHGWVNDKAKYLSEFHAKWGAAMSSPMNEYELFVTYDGLPTHLPMLVDSALRGAPDEMKSHYLSRTKIALAEFRTRSDPFSLPSQVLTDVVAANRRLFVEAASRVPYPFQERAELR